MGRVSHSCLVCFRPGLEPETSVALSAGFRHNECPRLAEGDYHPFEHHSFPNGEVWYRDSDHSYFTEVKPVTQGRGDGKGIVGYTGVQAAKVSSPSAISKYADPEPDHLMNWAARLTREGALEIREHLPFIADADELYEELHKRGLTWQQQRDKKGDTGTRAHQIFEDILRGKEPDYDVPLEERGYVLGVHQFFRDLGEFQTLQAEAVVYSAKHNYAGRFDGRIEVPLRDHSGEVRSWETWLLDLKTSGYIGRSYHNQLAGYDLAAEECGIGASDRRVIVQVFNEPDPATKKHYAIWPGVGSREGFLHNLACYEDGRMLDSTMEKVGDLTAYRGALMPA